MTVEQLRDWLLACGDEISSFMDYEITLRPDDELMEDMGEYWFRNPQGWNKPGYRFVHLGHDGTGGDVCAWIRPGADEPHPIVFLGSEGGRGVLAQTPERWAQIIAHAPYLDEYPSGDGPAVASSPGNWMLDDEEDEETKAEAHDAWRAYQKAAAERFGPLPPLEGLAGDVDALNSEFMAWADSASG